MSADDSLSDQQQSRTLGQAKVALCLGSGGVGKTTVAAALGIALAKRGERVVVLTIDPARRLADSLGLSDGLGNEPTEVALTKASGQLWAAMLDPTETFEAIVRDEATSPDQAERILSNALFHNLTRSLSGTSEYMAAERLHQLYNDDRFDRVVIDTPPSRHALDFLDSPNQMSRFVNHRLYRSVFAPRGGLLRTVSAGGQLALRLLGRIVGSQLVDDVVTFFANFEGLDAGFRRRADEIARVLHQETAFILVTSPRRQPLREATWIASNVAARITSPQPISTLVVNRVCPVSPGPNKSQQKQHTDNGALAENYRQLQTLAAQEHELVDEFVAKTEAMANLKPVMLNEALKPVNDLKSLESLAANLTRQLKKNLA